MKKMKEGELITNPDDKREFKNIRFERLKDNERVLYRGEYDKFNLKDRERYFSQSSNWWQLETPNTIRIEFKSFKWGINIC